MPNVRRLIWDTFNLPHIARHAVSQEKVEQGCRGEPDGERKADAMTQSRERKRSRRTKSRIPVFASVEEEAAWWDSHDITDYLDELTPVQVRFAKNLSQGLTIRFDEETLAELRRRAYEKGIGPTTLARMWILEHLRQIPS